MSKQPIEEQAITDYLLGAMPEADTERLDAQSLTDDEFAWRLQAAENDLVDAYVRDELSGEALAKFNSYYLSSAKRREKVRFAETFMAFAEKLPATRETVPVVRAASKAVPSKSARRPLFALPRLGLQWGFAAAALLMLVAGSYLIWANVRMRAQIAQTETERAAVDKRVQELERQLIEQRSSDAETEKELSLARERLAQLEQQLSAGQPGGEVRELKIIAFNLAPQMRSVGQIATLDVPPGTDYVALTLALETDDFPAYQAALKNPATGRIIWRSGRLKTSGQRTVRASLPASLLSSQNYLVELSGISATGAADLVGSYSFRVVRR